MKHWKKILWAVFLSSLLLAGCAGADRDEIHVLSREEGSGTRAAFVELLGIAGPDAAGHRMDRTRTDAAVTNSTAVMMTTIAGDPNGIGYLSFGSLNDTVKALRIDGAAPTAANLKNGSYPAARPFLIVTGGEVSAAAQDFLDYILSAEGQSVVEQSGYAAAVENPQPYNGSGLSGKIVAAGSSSVSPVMEALKEAYLQVNPKGEIEIQTSDSATGIHSAGEGICDMGMTSRALTETETAGGLAAVPIAIDGIAVIVSKENPVEDLTREQVRSIFTGEITAWSAMA